MADCVGEISARALGLGDGGPQAPMLRVGPTIGSHRTGDLVKCKVAATQQALTFPQLAGT